MAQKHVQIDMEWEGKRYALAALPIPTATKHTDWVPEAAHVFGRPALDEAISRWCPIRATVPPMRMWLPDEPVDTQIVRCLTVWQRLKGIATRIVTLYARELPDGVIPDVRWRVKFRRSLVASWWRHHGNGRVVQLAGGSQKTKNIADLAHIFLWERRNRDADYATARADIHNTEKLVREEAERKPTHA